MKRRDLAIFQFSTERPIQFPTDYPIQYATDCLIQYATDCPIQFTTETSIQLSCDCPIHFHPIAHRCYNDQQRPTTTIAKNNCCTFAS